MQKHKLLERPDAAGITCPAQNSKVEDQIFGVISTGLLVLIFWSILSNLKRKMFLENGHFLK